MILHLNIIILTDGMIVSVVMVLVEIRCWLAETVAAKAIGHYLKLVIMDVKMVKLKIAMEMK